MARDLFFRNVSREAKLSELARYVPEFRKPKKEDFCAGVKYFLLYRPTQHMLTRVERVPPDKRPRL
jgi:hypothetical protein